MYFYCWISTPAKDLSGSRFQSLRSHAPHGRGIATPVADRSRGFGNEHGKPKIQPCDACVSSSMALCVWPCNCYGPHSDHQPDLLWDLDLYARLARADAVGVYRADQLVRVHLELQAAVRSACLHERRQSSTGFDRQGSTVLAQALERSTQWRELSKNHLEGRSAAFFCYGDRGAADLDAAGRPKIHKGWFNPKDEPYDNERNAYQNLILAMSLQWHRGAGLTLELCRDRSWKTVSRYASGQP